MSVVLRKPSVAVFLWGALVLALFAWHGDLAVEPDASSSSVVASDEAGAVGAEAPVVVRRPTETTLPSAQRRGVVYDSMGFLLVGAEVVAAGRDAIKTSSEGAFAVELVEQESSDVLVKAEGRRAQWLRTSAVAPESMVVCLEPSAPWDVAPSAPLPPARLRGEGEVLGPNGEPLPNAYVNVLGTDCWGRTDEVGRVELPLPDVAATFVVHGAAAGGYSGGFGARSEPFVAPRDHGIVPLPQMVAQSAGSIRGVVRDVRGVPVAGVPIEVRGAGSVRRITSGAGGAFVLQGLLADDYVVEPLAYRGEVGVASTVRVDRPVVACDVQLALAAEANLLVVNEAGDAAAGVWVASHINGLRRGLGQADADGFVRLPVIADAEFEVRSADDYAACPVQRFRADAERATLVISQP